MNDTFIFLVLAGIALAFKWLTKRAEEAGQNSEAPPNESPNDLPERSEEERIRKFLEALGAPPGAKPPPPVRPRAVGPRRVIAPRADRPRRARRWEQPLPPLTTAPPPLPREEEIAAAPAAPAVVELPPAPILVPTPLPTAPRAAPSRFSLGEMLRARGRVRQAILLREILGPPRGLQDLRSF